MGASKAPIISGVGLTANGEAGYKVWSNDRVYALRTADRSTLMAVGKWVGAFLGKGSPLGMTKEDMLKIVSDAVHKHAEQALKASSASPRQWVPSTTEPSAPTVAEPKAEPKPEPKAVPTPTGSVDGAILALIRQVVTEVVASTPSPSVDPTALADLRSELLAEIEAVKSRSVSPTQIIVNGIAKEPTNEVRHAKFGKVLQLVHNREHVYLVGPAGTGKSTIPQQVAKELGMDFYAVSCGTTDGKHDYAGYRDGHGVLHTTEFRKAFEGGGVFLLDEMDNASPDMLVVLNSALANGFFAFPDGTVRKHDDFVVVGSGNTFGNGATAQYVGRSPIDAATMDRFTKLEIEIDSNVEDAMASSIACDGSRRELWLKLVRIARANVERHGLRVLVTPRATVKGLKVLAMGWTADEAINATFGFGLDEIQRGKVLEGTEPMVRGLAN